MKVFVTGATGFVGRMLVARLLGEGHDVIAWCRNAERGRDALGADVEIASYAQGSSIHEELRRCDAIINLQGENVMSGRWSSARKRRIVESRVNFTRKLTAAIHNLGPDAPRVFLSASAIGYYGDSDAALDERHPPGSGFLSDLCVEWEDAASQAASPEVRVALMRIGLVLGRSGGALGKMLPAFSLGLGGRIGSGSQQVSWIHMSDLVSMFVEALVNDDYRGAINATAPTPITNQEFSNALAESVGRGARWPVPAAVLKLALGDSASVLLGGQAVLPRRALELGFEFQFSEISEALDDLTRERSIVIRPAHGDDADFVLEQKTWVDAPIDEVFDFFSKAENLGAMTPPDLTFGIRGAVPRSIEAGTRIEYDIELGPVPMRWESLIEQWDPGRSFVDTQLRGPYAHWWHEHTFEARAEGTLMRDTVRYRLPLGPLGHVAHRLFVRSKLRGIFGHRAYFTRTRFPKRRQSRKESAAA